MRHLMAWATIVTGACMVSGCKGKSAQDALEGVGPVSKDSSMTTPSDNADNTPATFHANHEKQTVAAPGTFSDNGRYVVQVRVFETRARADEMVAKLSALGFPAYVAVVEDPTADLPGTYYRVRISGFDSREAASAFGEASLKPQGYDFWVDAKANDHAGTGSGTSKTDTSTAAAAPAPAQSPTPSPRELHRRHAHVSVSGSMAAPPFGTVRPDNTPRFSGHVGLDVGAPPPPPPSLVTPAASARVNVQATVPPPPPPLQSAPQPMVNTSESAAAAPNATAAPTAAPAVKMSFGATAPDGSEPTPAAAPAPQMDTNSPSAPAPASSPSSLKDTMQGPFAREGYYRPVDSSTPPPATSVPDADTATDSRRTLPTW